MTEQGSAGEVDIGELKTHGELKEHALRLYDSLFADPALSRITIRNIENWTELFPELAKGFSVLKRHRLELISYVRYASDEISVNSSTNGDELDEDDDEEVEEWSDEEEEPTLKIELNFLPPEVEEDDEEPESAPSEVHFCLYEKDSYAHTWSSVEEKQNIFFERSVNTRKGAVPRLRIITEVLDYAAKRVSA